MHWFGVLMFLGVPYLFSYDESYVFAPVLMSVIYGAVICMFVNCRMFTNFICVWLGRISYPLYLLQYPFLMTFGLYGLIALPFWAVITHYFVESPFMKFGSLLLVGKGRLGVEGNNRIEGLPSSAQAERALRLVG